MPIIPIENVGRIGIVVDDKPHNLPPEAWSDGKNIRFADNALRKSLGQEGFSGATTALTTPVYKNTIVPTGTLDWDYPDKAILDQDGSHLVIGASQATHAGVAGAGRVYYYDINSDGFHSNERLIVPDAPVTAINANFGVALSLSADGSVIAVGAYREKADDDSLDAGGIYIFNVDGSGVITQVAHFYLSGVLYQYLGVSLELSDDGATLVVGAAGKVGGNPTQSGMAYVFEESGGTWSLVATLTETTPVADALFGANVAINGAGDRIATGAYLTASQLEGELQIFKKSGGTWPTTPDEVLTGSSSAEELNFPDGKLGLSVSGTPGNPGKGIAFSQDGLRIAVGDTGAVEQREAWSEFTSDVDIWTVVGTAAIAVDTNRLRVTGSADISNAARAVVTVRINETLQINLDYEEGSAPAKDFKLALGTAVGLSDLALLTLSGDTLNYNPNQANLGTTTSVYISIWLDGGIAGETFFLDHFKAYRAVGAAYIFEESGGTYSEVEVLYPSLNAMSNSLFGWSVALNDAGDLLHVGAPEWDLQAAPFNVGSVYTFIRDTVFTETAKILPQVEVANNYYGWDVSIAGDTSKFSINDTQDNAAGRSHTDIFAGTAETIPSAPHFLLPWKTLTEKLWLYPGVDKCYKTDGTTHTEVTRYTTTPGDDDYDAGSRPLWTGGVLHGVPVLNHRNITDYPQQWDDALGRMKDLDNWPVDTYAKVLRTYKNFLVALDITKTATRYPFMVKWSDIADPGSVPGSWDETLATTLAGENTIAQSNGWLVDCAPLGDLNVIYKQDSIWGMQHIGGINVFRFFEISQSIGAIAPRCIKEFYRKHLVVGRNDIVLFDGNQPRSIVNKRMRRWFFNNLNPDYLDYTMVALNPPKQELWICFVENGSTSNYLTKALIWNWDSNTWAVKDLPDVSFLAYGNINVAADTFDASLGTTFNNDFGTFDGEGVSDAKEEIMFAKAYQTSQLFHGDTGYTNDGASFTSYIERIGLSVAGVDAQGNPKADPSKRKFLRAVYPKISAGSEAIIQVSAGSQETPNGPVTWEGPYDFNTLTDTRVDFRVSGNYLAVRFEDTANLPWEMTGYGLDLEVIGEGGR